MPLRSMDQSLVLHFNCATLLLPSLHSSIFPSTSIAHFHCNYSSFAKCNYIFCMHMFFNLVANFNNVFCVNIIIPYILTVHFQYGLFNSVCYDFVCICVVPILYSAPMQYHNQVSLLMMAILTHGSYKRRCGWFIVWVNTVPYGHHQLYSKGYQLVSL